MEKTPKVFCITGMHRSGTSMITRLLNICGLYLGSNNDLLKPAPDNPKGFWENVNFLELNDKILEALDGSWDFPPTDLSRIKYLDKNHPLWQEASHLLKQFENKMLWGWKDPRNCLTLPFWKKLIPGIKTIICLRNPIEVARSLQKRGGTTDIFAYKLWYIYNANILKVTTPEERIITHYDSYLLNPQSELSRVLEFMGCEKGRIEAACNQILNYLKHNNATTEQLLIDPRVPEEVKALYITMCEEAGFIKDKGLYSQYPGIAKHKDNNGRPLSADKTNQLPEEIKASLPELEKLIKYCQENELHVQLDLILGELCYSLGLLNKAEFFFKRALKKAPENPDALNNMAVISFHHGDHSSAERLLLNALKIQPDHEQAKLNLAMIKDTGTR